MEEGEGEGEGQIKADTDSTAKLPARQRGKSPKAELKEQANTNQIVL